jgi:hypothetical protein
MQEVKEFVRENSRPNIIQMCVPNRFDLYVNSCVNKDVEVFNRQLRKQMKVFENTALIKLDSRKRPVYKTWVTLE